MKDFSALEYAPNLTEFSLVQGEKQEPEYLEPVLKNPNVKSVSGYFGSDKKNRWFEAMKKEYGISV